MTRAPTTNSPSGGENRRSDRRSQGAQAAAQAGARRRGREAWGRAAENQIAERYAAVGGEILARRLRTPFGEIDLVVALQDVVVFVEVKARRTLDAAAYALNGRQAARLTAAAEHFLSDHVFCCAGARDARFDVAAVSASGGVEIVENALVGGMA